MSLLALLIGFQAMSCFNESQVRILLCQKICPIAEEAETGTWDDKTKSCFCGKHVTFKALTRLRIQVPRNINGTSVVPAYEATHE